MKRLLHISSFHKSELIIKESSGPSSMIRQFSASIEDMHREAIYQLISIFSFGSGPGSKWVPTRKSRADIFKFLTFVFCKSIKTDGDSFFLIA